jgi:hypothetical protein
MEEENQEVNEAKSLIENVSDATNGPRFGIFEQVLCSLIYQAANNPDPMRKVQLVTDGAMMLEPDKQKSLGIDIVKVKIIKTVNTAFLSTILTAIPNKRFRLVTLRFGFEPTIENFNKFIKPWYYSGSFHYFPQYVSDSLCIKYRVYFCSRCHNEVGNDNQGLLKPSKIAARTSVNTAERA